MEQKNMSDIDGSRKLTEEDLRRKRKTYTSLDDMAKEEGIIEVLKFLSTDPTMMGGHYRHTRMPIVPFAVKSSTELF